jgi:hypothetical protein
MMSTVVRWQLPLGCMAVAAGAVLLGFSGAVAAAEPTLPSPPTPDYAQVSPPVVTPIAPVAPQAVGVAPSVSAPAAPGPIGGATPTAAPPTPAPASSGTLREYLAAKGVQLEPQQAADFTALDITLPVPRGWTQVPDPNVPDAFAVIANRNSGALYTPNAQVVVYQLIGDFDPKEAITHGYVENQQLPAWRTSNFSLADFGGFPSSLIEGTYRQNDATLNTSQRHVIAASGSHNYLVSTTVTTEARGSVASAPATNAIVNGFRVTVPGTSQSPPRAPAPTATAPETTTTAPAPAATSR